MPQLRSRRLGSVAAALLVPAAALAGCASSGDAGAPEGSAAPPTESGPPAELLSAGLRDSVEPRPGGVVAWTTTWVACFGPADGAQVVRWESRSVTSEGSSPDTDELPGGCIDLQVATGVNPADAGMPGRELQLSDAQTLAYRVRAVHPDGTVTPWTDAVRVGRHHSAVRP
ncbi:MAG: hypothetical protein ACLGI3_11145 [Actinomycetes bacterium]